jgi:DNA ligase-1
MKFAELATYFEKIESTSSRLTITELLADLFKKLHADEIDKTMYLLQGRVAPQFTKIEMGMAEKMVIRSSLLALNMDKDMFNKKNRQTGDVGKTIESFKKEISTIEEKELSIIEVFEQLEKIANSSGPGSQDIKINILSHLFRQADSLTSRYLARIPTGSLRLGFSDMTVLDALSWMIKGDKSLRPIIEGAYHVRPDLGFVGKLIKEKGIAAVQKVKPAVFTPIIMMRAERLGSSEAIIQKLGKCVMEPKYDGFRLQVHYSKKKNEVRLYSRSLEETSEMYPDIIEGIKKEVKAEEIIIEGEAIGYDVATNTFLPFQQTVQRKRKYDVAEKAKEIPLKLFVFEILYIDGESLLQTPFTERRKKLEKAVKPSAKAVSDTILLAPDTTTDDPKELELLFDDAITNGLEGMIVKKMDGIYQPGARGFNWIKFKKSYGSSIGDTIDCLVMGYDYGKGKRADFGIGAFLVGVYEGKNDVFKTDAKIGTGLSDDEWRELKKRSDKFKSAKQPAIYDVDKMMSVDVWIKPEIVVEIKADIITRSTMHTAGRVLKPSKSGSAFDVETPGYALRFPRLVSFRDKKPEDSTSLKEVEELFKLQK